MLVSTLLALSLAAAPHSVSVDSPQILAAHRVTFEALPRARASERSEDLPRLRLRLPEGGTLVLALSPNALLDGSHRVRSYAGYVEGQPGSWVRLSRIGGAWMGTIRTLDAQWFVDPARLHPELAQAVGVEADEARMLVYSARDLRLPEAPLQDAWSAVRPPPVPVDAPSRTGPPYYIGLSVVLDTEFQQRYGSNAVAAALAMINAVDGYYASGSETRVYLEELRVLEDNGPMTSTAPGQLLGAFAQWGREGDIRFKASVHLLSGKEFDGSTLGLAFQPGMCDRNYGYGINQATLGAASAGLVAHELGHNYSANHDGQNNACPNTGFIMQPWASSNPPTTFSACSLSAFASFRQGSSGACLAAPPDPLLTDGFEAAP